MITYANVHAPESKSVSTHIYGTTILVSVPVQKGNFVNHPTPGMTISASVHVQRR